MSELNTQNIQHDKYDHGKFTKMFFETDLKKTITQGVGEYQQFSEMAQDMFYSMYKYAPQYEDPEKVAGEYQFNRQFLDQAMGTQAWQQLRAYTKLNPESSALAAATLSENILKENADLFKQMKKQQQAVNQQKKQIQQLKHELDDIKAQPKTYQTEQMRKNLEKRAAARLKTLKQAQAQMEQTAGQISVYSAAKKCAETTQQIESLFHSYGGDDPGTSITKVSIQDRINFSKAFVKNNRFQKLMKLIGKMQRIAEKKQKEKTRHARETVDDIIQSDDVQHLVASEMLLLCEPDLQILFDKKYVEKGLLTYELNAQLEKGKGPIVCALDISGSMTGDKDLIAKAVALALVHIAHMQKRDAFVMLFDARIQYCEEFAKKDGKWWEKLTKMVEVFTGRDTSYNPPVQKAIEIFQTKETYHKADFVVVTDMDYGFAEKVKQTFLDLKHEKKISTYCIIVDPRMAALDLRSHCISPICDTMVAVDELTDQTAGDLFEAI